jgi:hypothetical protein
MVREVRLAEIVPIESQRRYGPFREVLPISMRRNVAKCNGSAFPICNLHFKPRADEPGKKRGWANLGQASIELRQGAEFILTARPTAGSNKVATASIPEFISVIRVGDTVLLADGELRLKAISTSPAEIR